MELDIGDDTDRGESALFRVLGATSVESYVTWQTVEDAGEGQWDWSRWDRQVEILRRAGLKWAPLLVSARPMPLPKWYRESDRSVPYVCLEHGQASKIQSLWNPGLAAVGRAIHQGLCRSLPRPRRAWNWCGWA